MTEVATPAQTVLVARFPEHKSAALAAEELMNAGIPQSDLTVVFEQGQRLGREQHPSSLRTALQRALELARLCEGRVLGRAVRPKIFTIDTGATLTVQTHEGQEGARAILSQHGGELA